MKNKWWNRPLSSPVQILIIFVTSLLFVLPVLYLAGNRTFRLYSDYDSMLPMYDFVSTYIRNNLQIPNWNPYMGMGIPVLGDPLSGAYNPFLILPFVFWGTSAGTRFIYWEIVFLSGIAMWFFLKRIGVGDKIRIWGACLYAVSGTVVSKFGAGHVEQFFALPLIPLILGFLFHRELKISDLLAGGLFLAALLYSGSTYHLFYMVILVTALRLGYIFPLRKNVSKQLIYLVSIFLVALLVSIPKLLDFYLRVMPIMYRHISDPTRGSLPVYLSFVPFIMPLTVPFYGRPRIEALTGIYFHWYEYYAYLSPLPFAIFLKFRTIFQEKRIRLLAIPAVTAVFFIASGFTYSPFNWAYKYIPVFGIFRVPQRMYVPLTSIMVALFAVGMEVLVNVSGGWRKTVMALALGSILLTFPVTQYVFYTEAFEVRDESAMDIVRQLKNYDGGNYFVAGLYPRIQGYLIHDKIPIVNYYYGWRNKNSPIYRNDDFSINLQEFKNYRPKYIIADIRDKIYITAGYRIVLTNDKAAVWQTDTVNMTQDL